MHRNQSVDLHQFAMIPRAEIPRSSFTMQKTLKTTIDGTYLYPVFCEEVLPGDTFRLSATMFARLNTPLFPFMDNLYLDSFWFFCPMRLVWDNWERFMGQQDSPGDPIDYEIPGVVPLANGYAVGSLYDHFGLPTVGQVASGQSVDHSILPIRMYGKIWNEWFRDENLQDQQVVHTDDGPDDSTDYVLLPRGKRHDYFTSALPWPEKGGVGVPLPLGTTAPVIPRTSGGGTVPAFINAAGDIKQLATITGNNAAQWDAPGLPPTASQSMGWYTTALEADLSAATAATVNQLRMSFQIQKLLERDARGGTRYTEIIRSHFGVVSPDARLQRPEYLGGGSTPIQINPIPQTSATTVTGTDTPQGNLAAMGTALKTGDGFSQSFVEHGYVIGLVSVRADLTYQQGLRRHWSRKTRYDFYFPVFAMLGEQAILSKEIFADGSANDEEVFGYQERWAEYRYLQSEITGLMRSNAAGTIDQWHLAQEFGTRPVLNEDFIKEPSGTVLERVIAVGSEANGQQFKLDCFFNVKAARPMPLYSVPGMIDHF